MTIYIFFPGDFGVRYFLLFPATLFPHTEGGRLLGLKPIRHFRRATPPPAAEGG